MLLYVSLNHGTVATKPKFVHLSRVNCKLSLEKGYSHLCPITSIIILNNITAIATCLTGYIYTARVFAVSESDDNDVLQDDNIIYRRLSMHNIYMRCTISKLSINEEGYG